MKVVLASASPRRAELLKLLLPAFDCDPTDIDETPLEGEPPKDYVERMAREKALASPHASELVIAADTTVTLDGDILGKPLDHADALSILERLSGATHEVMTAIALRLGERLETRVVTTRVSFAHLDEETVRHYLDSAEPWDKAGAYGIQGFAGSFVTSIEGSYSAVVGLPLYELRVMLKHFGVAPVWREELRG